MKKYIIASMITFGMISAQAQYASGETPTIQVGDTIELNEPSSGKYKYVKFPPENFIIKRGGILNMKALDGEQVIVTKVKKTKNDATKIRVKRKNGRNFFNRFPSVTVLFEDALRAGEIDIK